MEETVVAEAGVNIYTLKPEQFNKYMGEKKTHTICNYLVSTFYSSGSFNLFLVQY